MYVVQVRKAVFTAWQNEERKAKNACQETHASSDIRRSAQGDRQAINPSLAVNPLSGPCTLCSEKKTSTFVLLHNSVYIDGT